MHNLYRLLVALFFCLTTASCLDINPEDSAASHPSFNLKEFFNGRVKSHGVIYDWYGRVYKQFIVELDCSWHENNGVINEVFKFSDGTTLNRKWTLIANEDGTFDATAPDVKGTAKGKEIANGMYFKYDLIVNLGKKTMVVSANDFMYKFKDGAIMGKVDLKKFGITVGHISMFMEKIKVR